LKSWLSELGRDLLIFPRERLGGEKDFADSDPDFRRPKISTETQHLAQYT
jgi:hypothetical protein